MTPEPTLEEIRARHERDEHKVYPGAAFEMHTDRRWLLTEMDRLRAQVTEMRTANEAVTRRADGMFARLQRAEERIELRQLSDLWADEQMAAVEIQRLLGHVRDLEAVLDVAVVAMERAYREHHDSNLARAIALARHTCPALTPAPTDQAQRVRDLEAALAELRRAVPPPKGDPT